MLHADSQHVAIACRAVVFGSFLPGSAVSATCPEQRFHAWLKGTGFQFCMRLAAPVPEDGLVYEASRLWEPWGQPQRRGRACQSFPLAVGQKDVNHMAPW